MHNIDCYTFKNSQRRYKISNSRVNSGNNWSDVCWRPICLPPSRSELRISDERVCDETGSIRWQQLRLIDARRRDLFSLSQTSFPNQIARVIYSECSGLLFYVLRVGP